MTFGPKERRAKPVERKVRTMNPTRPLILCLLLLATTAFGQEVDLLIQGGTVVTMDSERRVYQPGYVAIKDGRIFAVGPGQSKAKAREILEAKGKAVVPGLVNTHTHLPMVLFRGLADDLPIETWLQKVIFPAEAANTDKEFVRIGSQLGLLEMIRGGTTTFCDMYYFEEVIAEETKSAGLRAVLGQTVLDFPAPDRKTWQAMLQSVRAFAGVWKNDPLIQAAIAPHAPYTVSRDHWLEVKALAEELDIPILTHLAEAPMEMAYTQKHYQQRSVMFLNSLGLLTPRLVGAHGIYVNPAEQKLLADKQVGIAHCPESNMKVAVGVSPVPELLQAGVRVGLGTDGAASNNNLDMWQEMNTAAKLHKNELRDPTAMPAEEVFALATIGGALALHQEKSIGSLESGKWADIVLVDLEQSHLKPMYNIYSVLVYAVRAGDVTDTIVAGKVLMRDRQVLTVDQNALFPEVARMLERITKSLD